MHKIKQSWTNNYFKHRVFLDKDGAFDRVWHSAMIAKLNQIGIKGNLFTFFNLFLINRKRKLGPLLFVIYLHKIGVDSEFTFFLMTALY